MQQAWGLLFCAAAHLLAEFWRELLPAQVADGLVHPALVLVADQLVGKHAAALVHPQAQQVALWGGDATSIRLWWVSTAWCGKPAACVPYTTPHIGEQLVVQGMCTRRPNR